MADKSDSRMRRPIRPRKKSVSAETTKVPTTKQELTTSDKESSSRLRGVVSRTFEKRKQGQKKSERKRWMKTILICVASLAVIALVVWGIFFSPLMTVRASNISVSGAAGVVKEDDVKKSLKSVVGTPVARVDTSAIAKRLQKVDGVKSAVVTRSWPTGLSVAITPRTPVAAVTNATGTVMVDEEGVTVSRAPVKIDDLPRVTVLTEGEGQYEPTLKAALSLLGELPTALRSEMTAVKATSPDMISMTVKDGSTVVWGNDRDLTLKMDVLKVLREKAKASVYDVSSPDTPVTR